MANILLLILSASTLMYLDTSAYTEVILICTASMAYFVSRHDVDSRHLSLIVLMILSAETAIQASQILIPDAGLENVWKNTIIYSTYLVFDLIALFCVMLRPAISRTLFPDIEVRMTKPNILLISVYVLFAIINVVALGENILRNLEHIGVPEDIARWFWSWDVVYYSYPTLKRVVIGLQLFALLMIIRESMPSLKHNRA